MALQERPWGWQRATSWTWGHSTPQQHRGPPASSAVCMGTASWLGEVTTPLCSALKGRYCLLFGAPDMEKLSINRSYWGGCSETVRSWSGGPVGLPSQGKGWLGNIAAASLCLQAEEKPWSLLRSSTERGGSSWVQGKHFTCEDSQALHRLQALSLEAFKTQLFKAQATWADLWTNRALGSSLDCRPPQVPSNLSNFVVLMASLNPHCCHFDLFHFPPVLKELEKWFIPFLIAP